MFHIVGKALIEAVAGQSGEIASRALHELLDEAEMSSYTSKVTEEVIGILFSVPGITQAHSRDLKRATPIFSLKDGTVVKFYQNPVGCHHIFLADGTGNLIYGGFVGWIHLDGLKRAISQIRRDFT